ncbi:MAG TPA: kelch repeat-containing protein [Anaeromyxobacter sp.]|nr:kelch repeat-containing protein [Anaeromyxobacter sp.]
MTPRRLALLCLVTAASACGGPRPSPLPDEPTLQVSRRELTFTMGAYEQGSVSPAFDEVLVSTSAPLAGAPTVAAQYEQGDGWLEGDLTPRSPGYALTVQPARVELLAAGTYRALLLFRWPGAVNAPVVVDVELTIRPHPQTWEPGPMNVAASRSSHRTTALLDGGALVAGGFPVEASIERLDPSTWTWSAAGTFREARWNHSATLLHDGRVLFAGGQSQSGAAPGGTWELWDPALGGISEAGRLAKDRWYHAAVRLLDGRVLLVGGYRREDGPAEPVRGTRSCELFDPATETSTETGALHGDAPEAITAVLLQDGSGRVLAITRTPEGAQVGAELYDPEDGTWTVAASRAQPRVQHATVALRDGRVLVFGGRDPEASLPLRSSELYDPATDRWTLAGELAAPHGFIREAATLLPSGAVLVAGGALNHPDDASFQYTELVETFDPATEEWTIAGALRHELVMHTVTALGDGSVWAVGGVFDLDGGVPDVWRPREP